MQSDELCLRDQLSGGALRLWQFCRCRILQDILLAKQNGHIVPGCTMTCLVLRATKNGLLTLVVMVSKKHQLFSCEFFAAWSVHRDHSVLGSAVVWVPVSFPYLAFLQVPMHSHLLIPYHYAKWSGVCSPHIILHADAGCMLW